MDTPLVRIISNPKSAVTYQNRFLAKQDATPKIPRHVGTDREQNREMSDRYDYQITHYVFFLILE